jgi:phosphate transport system protein
MNKHLLRDMEDLHREILSMSAIVEEMIDKAAQSLRGRPGELAAEVAEADKIVDRREVHIEEECLKMLALHQPVAVDLRRIATVLKVNNDLERIADLAVNIAERAHSIDETPNFPIPRKMEEMVTLATQMVRGALDAFVNLDAESARRILPLDDAVDRLNCEIIGELQTIMQSSAKLVPAALHCFSASRHVERIADHATNIAEDVIYLVEGDIVRHKHDVARNSRTQ